MAEMETGYAAASDTGPQSQSRTRELATEGREKVVEYGGKARQKAMEMADARKSGVVASLERFANSLEEAGGGDGGPERQVVETAAKYVRQAKDLLEQRSSDELLNMAVEGLRKRPGAIIVGMFGIGFLGARLLRT